MVERRVDILAGVGRADAICCTTNGYTNKSGLAVMGRGTAKVFRDTFPGLASTLAMSLRQRGNHVAVLGYQTNTALVSFPVKPTALRLRSRSQVVPHLREQYAVGDLVPGYAALATLELVEQSAIELVALAEQEAWLSVWLPRPGCNNGGLSWSDVQPVLTKHLDDRFTIVHM